jgi:two-component system, chemotaxis family, CheB/CheR fusion protein
VSKTKSELADEVPSSSAVKEFEALLVYLKRSRGFDFSAYKHTSLMRRVLVRMQVAGIRTFPEYQDRLQVDPEEFTRLFNTILINVTSFFRDAETWGTIADSVLPSLLHEIGPSDPIRIWSAGCASGEEAYTLAILLAEALGVEQYRERVKIYGTDVDEEALNQARTGVYESRAMEEAPAELVKKYFQRHADRLEFSQELRRRVIFGRHDLLQDAPISRVNLLTCRNCLMYFNTQAQSRIISRFHFALRDAGILVLGKAETLLTHSINFGPVDVKRRIFAKAPGSKADDRRLPVGRSRDSATGDPTQRLIDESNEVAPMAQLIVDNSGRIVQVTGRLRTLFGVSARDVGRPLQDLELSYRPFELRSCIDRAQAERRVISQTDGKWTGPSDQMMFLELAVIPITDANGSFLGCSIIFTDATRARALQDEVERAHQELETALEELQSTNEELETTNEELQSTVEELETTNEELQSTNEELETMNQELQATNEELQGINDEVGRRSQEVTELNSVLESTLSSLSGAVIMLDRDFQISRWSQRAEDMWGLRPDEVFQMNFLNLETGLPVEQLRTPVKACLAQEAESLQVSLEATNRRGKRIQLKVTCSPLVPKLGAEPTGVILVMEEEPSPA